MRLGLALYFVSSVIEKKKEPLKSEAILEDIFHNILDIFTISLHGVFFWNGIGIENSEIKITGSKIGWDPDPFLVLIPGQ